MAKKTPQPVVNAPELARAAQAAELAKPRAKNKRARPSGGGVPVGEPRAARGALVDSGREARVRRTERLLVGAGAAAMTGIAMVGTGPSPLGPFLTLGGMIALIVGVHLLGRLGPDPA